MQYVTGVDQVLDGLRRLSREYIRDYLRTGLRAGANVVRPAVINEASRFKNPTGRTAAAVRVRASRFNRRGGDITYLVTLGEGLYKGDTFYGAFVELGHFVGSRKLANRKQVPALHWMKAGLDNSREAATQKALDVIWDLIENGKPVSGGGDG